MSHTSRRSFLATGAAAFAAPFVSRTLADEAKPIILGEGEHRYECIHDWGKLPDTIAWGITHGIAVDKQSNVHVFHTSKKENACKGNQIVQALSYQISYWRISVITVGGVQRVSCFASDNREACFTS